MSNDDLRAVADRLRRLKAGKELSQDIYGVETPPRENRAAYLEACHKVKVAMVKDERAAITAFIESHPADDTEPADFEWLAGQAERQQDDDPERGDVWWEIGPLSFTCDTYYPDPGEPSEVVAADWQVDGETLPTALVPKTRGQFRRLLAAVTGA